MLVLRVGGSVVKPTFRGFIEDQTARSVVAKTLQEMTGDKKLNKI